MGLQQERNFNALLKTYPQFKRIGVFRREKWEPTGKPGRTPANKDFHLVFVPDNDACAELAKIRGVYILKQKNFDFYVGHAGAYDAPTDGWDQRHKRYRGGLGQEKVDTNKKIAEHAFTSEFEVFYFANPTAMVGGREIYVGEAVETDCIVTFDPIFNDRNF